ncbi:MAG: hypothetical protein NTV22_15500 [bacterium]|nr:hypothetical protein [bacterium]
MKDMMQFDKAKADAESAAFTAAGKPAEAAHAQARYAVEWNRRRDIMLGATEGMTVESLTTTANVHEAIGGLDVAINTVWPARSERLHDRIEELEAKMARGGLAGSEIKKLQDQVAELEDMKTRMKAETTYMIKLLEHKRGIVKVF